MKHKPATPLPWHRPLEVCEAENAPSLMLVQPAAYFVKCAPLDVAAIILMPAFEKKAGAEAQKRATYIAHAANAYPRLVEALREFTLNYEGVSAMADDSERTALDETRDTARAILRDLGEL